MSRSAAALAYDLPATTPRRASSAQPAIRLLGGGRSGTKSHQQPAYPLEVFKQPPGSPHVRLLQAYELDWEAYAPSAVQARSRVQVRHPLWLAASVICALVLVVVLVHGFTTRGSTPGRRLYLAGYTADGAKAGSQEPPVIDLTTKGEAKGEAAAPPAEVRSPGNYDLIGAPSIGVQQIESVLAKYGSSAVGKGQALYDLGVRYGIDPVFALAFFVHESGCGTRGVARFTHSLGNIRWTPGFDNYEGYRSYPSWEAGFEDWYKLITDLYINGWGLRTVDKIVPVYAPSEDNNSPPAYIQAVKSMVDNWRGK